MEIKEITAEGIQTVENLMEAVNYYHQIQEEIKRLQMSKDIAEESILAKFRDTGMRYFDTPSGLRARTYTREGNNYISVEEAKALLSEDDFNKLLKQGETIVILSVRPIKSEEDNAER